MTNPDSGWWDAVWAKIRGVTYFGPLAFWRKLPIVGPLASCTLKNHAEAFSEFVVNLLFGTLTFWGTALLLMTFASSKGMGFGDLLFETISSGQLYIFAVGMLGPILLTTSTSEEGERKFPSQRWHLVALILLGIFATGFYSQSLAVRRGSQDFDAETLLAISAGIAICAILLRYLAVVTKKSMDTLNVDERIRQPERTFTSDFSERHGGGSL